MFRKGLDVANQALRLQISLRCPSTQWLDGLGAGRSLWEQASCVLRTTLTSPDLCEAGHRPRAAVPTHVVKPLGGEAGLTVLGPLGAVQHRLTYLLWALLCLQLQTVQPSAGGLCGGPENGEFPSPPGSSLERRSECPAPSSQGRANPEV